MSQMFFLLSAGTRRSLSHLAHAFSSQSRAVTALSVSKINNQQLKHTFVYRTFASARDATIENDLDSALDELLGSTTSTEEVDKQQEKPKAKKLEQVFEEEKVDYDDPEFLSIRNPKWTQAGLPEEVIEILSEKGITQFTPVQGKAFDPIKAGRDVIGRSRTGTGKTIAFGLPAMIRLDDFLEKSGKKDRDGRLVRGRSTSMVILCPTRELARQVQEELQQISRPMGLFVECFHGGVSYDPQARALRQGIDVLVGTPGRIMDHMQRGNLNLSECDIVVLDEADEMLNMGFAEDVEVIMEGVGSANGKKTQCLLFSATTPDWVKKIGARYQSDVISIDATGDDGGLRVAKTVKHLAIQLPPGADAKKAALEDIIAVHISRDAPSETTPTKKSRHSMQQKIFGKTIVFTETKRDADELVGGGVFKSLTAQALHGDVGQKQRDSILNAFREGAFNVLVATDVAARGIDIKDVDLVIQFDPPREVDTYVHRSGRTGRAGASGVSILLFNQRQSRDIVNIERQLGHGFKFGLIGPPSTEAALRAAARTSALASSSIPDDISKYFKDAAEDLLSDGDDPADIVSKCLAAISRRSNEVQSRSLITGELGFATIEMTNERGRDVGPGDVMFTVGKLARMSRREGDQGDLSFESDVGKIQSNPGSRSAIFDMSVEDAKKLVEFSKDVDTEGSIFKIIHELEIERDHNFGKSFERRGGGRGGGGNFRGGRDFDRGRGGRRDGNRSRDGNFGRRDGGGGGYRGGRGGDSPRQPQAYNGKRGDTSSRNFRGRYDNRSNNSNDGW